MLQFWIWLAQRTHVRPRMRLALLQRFGNPSAIYLADETALRAAEELRDNEIEELLDKDLGVAEKILQDCDKKRISVLTYGDVAYPDRLRNIADPPLVLYYEGVLPVIEHEALVAVVGKRHASAYGLQQAKKFGYQLSRSGFVIVSGAARGIDALALEGALTGGKTVIAVLGNGTDVVYPLENRKLYEDIRANGCLISEYPPGTKPLGEHFPARNRIMSGISLATLVIEADLRSGSMITARNALEQGRDVFAIPGNLGMPTFEGNHRLIKDGAYLAESSLDFVEYYRNAYPSVSDYAPGIFGAEPPKEEDKAAENDKKSVDNPAPANYIDINKYLDSASEDESKILCALQNGPIYVDDLIEQTQMQPAKLLSCITLLEIRKLVKRLPGSRFEPARE